MLPHVETLLILRRVTLLSTKILSRGFIGRKIGDERKEKKKTRNVFQLAVPNIPTDRNGLRSAARRRRGATRAATVAFVRIVGSPIVINRWTNAREITIGRMFLDGFTRRGKKGASATRNRIHGRYNATMLSPVRGINRSFAETEAGSASFITPIVDSRSFCTPVRWNDKSGSF